MRVWLLIACAIPRLRWNIKWTYVVGLFLAHQPPVFQGLLIYEVSRSHNDTPQSLRFFWKSRRGLHLTTHDTHNRLVSMPPVWLEPTISAVERRQTHAFYRAATGTGNLYSTYQLISYLAENTLLLHYKDQSENTVESSRCFIDVLWVKRWVKSVRNVRFCWPCIIVM
jgi:hypothetical protein